MEQATSQGTGAIQQFFGSMEAVSAVVIMLLILVFLILATSIKKISVFQVFGVFVDWLMKFTSKIIGKSEAKYHRDVAIGKLDEKRRTVRIYRSLNDLTIDLGLKQKGTKPYELLFLIALGAFVLTFILCQALFGSFWMILMMYPPVAIGLTCILYTRANIAHDTRIESVIEAENIICNNIRNGVVVAIRDCIEVMPVSVRLTFKDFLDNVDHKNMHTREALLELNANLGSIADDFIKKCIVFEYEEEHGIAGMFQDIVEINNIRTEMRIEMKRQFEQVMTQFKIGAAMIFAFLIGVLVIAPDVRQWYLTTALGRTVIAFDFLLLVLEYVYITFLRAREL